MGKITVHQGDCLDVLARMAADGVQVDSVCTDPPYHLTSIVKRFGAKNAAAAQHGTDGAFSRASKGFMGKTWDGGDISFRPETWAAVMAVMKPGAHLLAFNHSRTWHRMAVAIEDAGFEIRDTIMWIYGCGMPKSHNLHGEWDGWGSALKPSFEPIVLARKPLAGTISGNMAEHRVGALNIAGCKIGTGHDRTSGGAPIKNPSGSQSIGGGWANDRERASGGRWPANVIHDGSDEVMASFSSYGDLTSGTGAVKRASAAGAQGNSLGRESRAAGTQMICHGDTGSAARFFYSSKSGAGDRVSHCTECGWRTIGQAPAKCPTCGHKITGHPTVKPVDLMAYLCRLVTPPGGVVLDPFAGSGTTGMACLREGFDAILIEREAEYVSDINRRLAHVHGGDTPLFGGAA